MLPKWSDRCLCILEAHNLCVLLGRGTGHSMRGKSAFVHKGGRGGRNDQAHSSVKNSLHPKSPRQEEEEAGC